MLEVRSLIKGETIVMHVPQAKTNKLWLRNKWRKYTRKKQD